MASKKTPANNKAPASKAPASKAPASKKPVSKASASNEAIKKSAAAKAAKPVAEAPAKSGLNGDSGAKGGVSGGKVEKLSPFTIRQKQRLLDLRDELTDALVGVTRDTLRNAPSGSEASGSGMHQGDAGSDAYDRDFALSVLAKEQDALYEIAQALRRLEKGLYGVCEISGKKIPQARLEAIPFARLTVECQAEWEKEHGNRRFRPANEVGFGGGFYETDESESVSLDDDED